MTWQEQLERSRRRPPLHVVLALSMNDSADAASTSPPIRMPRDHNTFRRMLAILDTLGYQTDDVEPLEAGAQGEVDAPDWADTSPTQR